VERADRGWTNRNTAKSVGPKNGAKGPVLGGRGEKKGPQAVVSRTKERTCCGTGGGGPAKGEKKGAAIPG